MSQNTLDLRRSTQIVRRHRLFVGVMVVLGILGGLAYAVLSPAMVTSSALIALSPPVTSQQTSTGSTTTGTGADPFTSTQVVVATSSQVLADALPDVRPAMSLDALRLNVSAASPATDIISITAKGKNAADAEATANAVAGSYIRYVSSPGSAVGRVQAQLLQSAKNASGPMPIERDIIFALLGGLGGALIAVIVVLAIGRTDRRLRERDEIANSIGIPVFASVPVARPSSAVGWMKLLESYSPNAVHAWQLHTALRQLGMARPNSGRPEYNGNGISMYDDSRAASHDGDRFSLTVLSLSSDSGALALGPQLAAFAASQQIPTALVVGPQQATDVAATLRTACAVPPSEASVRNGMLRVSASDQGDPDLPSDTALVIVVAVVDGKAPAMPDTLAANATVIGVSAGAATAEQLARAAVAASAGGREITGILVADPEPTDQTTGRVPHLTRPARRRPPNRLAGIVTEIRR